MSDHDSLHFKKGRKKKNVIEDDSEPEPEPDAEEPELHFKKGRKKKRVIDDEPEPEAKKKGNRPKERRFNTNYPKTKKDLLAYFNLVYSDMKKAGWRWELFYRWMQRLQKLNKLILQGRLSERMGKARIRASEWVLRRILQVYDEPPPTEEELQYFAGREKPKAKAEPEPEPEVKVEVPYDDHEALAILGISQAEMSQAEMKGQAEVRRIVKQAAGRLIKEVHPDKNADDPDAKNKMIAIIDARNLIYKMHSIAFSRRSRRHLM